MYFLEFLTNIGWERNWGASTPKIYMYNYIINRVTLERSLFEILNHILQTIWNSGWWLDSLFKLLKNVSYH